MRVGILFGFVVILDQLTKQIIRQTMHLGDSFDVLGHVVRITYVENPGIAFGIRVGNNAVFTVLSIIASLGVLIYLFAHKDEGILMKSSLSLILGGAVGNLIDRILFKRVADFIDVGMGDLRWPVFNVADSAVVIGMVILFYTMYGSGKKEKESTPEEARELG